MRFTIRESSPKADVTNRELIIKISLRQFIPGETAGVLQDVVVKVLVMSNLDPLVLKEFCQFCHLSNHNMRFQVAQTEFRQVGISHINL